MFWLNRMLLGNTALRWLIALGVAAGVLVLARLALGWLRCRAGAPGAPAGLAGLFARTHFLFALAVAVALAAQFLEFPPRLGHGLDLILPVALLAQLAAWGHRGIGLWMDRRFGAAPASPGSGAGRAAVLGFLLRLALWSLVLLVLLDALGFNVTTLVASLGIGGIAVALAVQNILGDLFASLSIAMDEPFGIGDFIIIGECIGTVQFIGLKTTRIRSLSGEQIVISNSDLLKSRIRNFRKMQERRAVFEFSLARRTPADLVERVPARIRGIIEAQAKVRFDRAHFKEFGACGLTFEVAYYVLEPDMNLYMDIQQAINLGILRAFSADGLDLAFPARNLQVVDCAGPAGGAKIEP